MTSFDQPQAGLLVEHLLPSLLGANHSPSQDLKERTLFFGEIGNALERLRGRLTIISSPLYVARESSQYPWLWRYVSHFTVGAHSRAVQHAKLWAFHWKVKDEEHLDLYVSSTNLTTSAFKTQVQAGWQVSLPLGQRNSQVTRRTWGELVPFLVALGDSAGEIAATHIARLITLLGRVECPADVTFVASIPGNKSAACQLQQFTPSELHVLTPTIGEWNDRTLSDWSIDVGVASGKVHLKWISTEHPWIGRHSWNKAQSGWTLSTSASDTLKKYVQLECIPSEARFAKEHRDGDDRWSHAKLYLLRSGRKRRLLVTSANWSPAAWGAGKIKPRNFELGVVFESKWTDLEALGEPFDPPDTMPFCVDRTDEERASALEWAEASWDGKRILLRARSSDSSTPISAIVFFSDGKEGNCELVDGDPPRPWTEMPWTDATQTPLFTRFTQGTESIEIDILDLRLPTEFAKTPLPEVAPALAEALREAFLLQRYGGAVVDPESISGLGGGHKWPGAGTPATDYSVQEWLEASAAFDVVDNWRKALTDAETSAESDAAQIELIKQDGKELRTLFKGREGPAAALVAEELGWRMDQDA
ncbi:hypothetical protein DVT68_10700 [Dyella solisilvae]|uniref:Tyrosyl-DNA phosphodiesterase n=1 Tax=Dyella solisilvae TaxID=1920168 RepID=A0A370K8I0_9GAMM|nr:hypothetical protein [Dyella solisilvae]RDI98956.1 hypothetical protein DVT68_10700 [Dyella solisilvae]